MPIIKANRSRLGTLFWEQFSKYAVKLRFHSFDFDDVQVDPDKPLLMVANHISWWDGFWALLLNKKLLGKHFHVMMLEKELQKRGFLRKAGAFSISPSTRSLLESLKYTQKLLSDPANMVLMFPQGSIHSVYEDDFVFEKGMNRVLDENTQVLMAVALIDYGSHPRPSVFYSLKLIDKPSVFHQVDIQESFQKHYHQAVSRQKEKMKNLHLRQNDR